MREGLAKEVANHARQEGNGPKGQGHAEVMKHGMSRVAVCAGAGPWWGPGC